MPASALLPTTAPFAAAERSALDSVLSATTPMQRHWLAGFLAGLDAAPGLGAAAPVAVPAAPPRAAAPLTIVYATESGNSERLANDTAAQARKRGFRPKLIDMADLDVAALNGTPDLLMIAATWGEGEPPGRAAHAYAALMGDGAPRLDGTRFSVLALGDTSYAGFCTIGKELDARLEALGATRATPRVDCDLDYAVPAKAWIDASLLALAPVTVDPVADNVVAFARAAPAADLDDTVPSEPSREPFAAEVIEHHDLTSSRSSKRTVHLALDLGAHAPAYEPGDSLELFPANDAAMVEAVLAAARVQPDDALAAKLTTDRDITTLSVPTIERYATRAANHDLTAIVEGGKAREWAGGRQLVDLLETFPAELDADALLSLTRPLPPRAYSIASARAAVGDAEAHLVVAETRYATHGRPRAGVASGWIANRLKPGTELKARLRPNRHFRLPADPATDIVMVGPGTGVAPFRAFVQARVGARDSGVATGRNWLFFGDRRFNQDFLYQLEWQAALADGTLTRLDLAFSRDQPAKVYVQHRMAERAAELVAWLEGGAVFYVCGDATHMAKDVRRALVAAYGAVRGLGAEAAEAAVVGLEREKRYLTDVY